MYLEVFFPNMQRKSATVEFTHTQWVNEVSNYDHSKYGEYSHTSTRTTQVQRTAVNSFSFSYIEFNGYFIICENELFMSGSFESYEDMISYVKDGGAAGAKSSYSEAFEFCYVSKRGDKAYRDSDWIARKKACIGFVAPLVELYGCDSVSGLQAKLNGIVADLKTLEDVWYKSPAPDYKETVTALTSPILEIIGGLKWTLKSREFEYLSNTPNATLCKYVIEVINQVIAVIRDCGFLSFEYNINRAVTFPLTSQPKLAATENAHVCENGYQLGIATMMCNPNKGAWLSILYINSNNKMAEAIQSCTSIGSISMYSVSGMAMCGDKRIETNIFELFGITKNEDEQFVGTKSQVVEFNVAEFESNKGIEALINVKVIENGIQYVPQALMFYDYGHIREEDFSTEKIENIANTMPQATAIGIEFDMDEDLLNEYPLY